MNEIRTPEELDALPAGRSAVLDREGDIWMSAHRRRWVTADARGDVTPEELLRRFGPLTLLHPLPDAPAPSAEGREALAGVIALAMADDDLSFVGVEHEDAADAALAWFAARQPTPSFTPAQRHAAESDEALFRVATRALFGTGEVIDIVLRALGVPVVAPVVSAQTTTEWRVESENYEDEFGTDEAAARDWLRRCNMTPGWEASVLMTRTVTTASTPWQEVNPRG